MKFAILGSWREADREKHRLKETHEQFATACRELGRTLASRGQTIIGGGTSDETADYHVIMGALEAARDLPPRCVVEAIAPRDTPLAYTKENQDTTRPDPRPGPHATRVAPYARPGDQ